MKRLALILLVACAAPPREVKHEPPPQPAQEPPPRPAAIVDENVAVEYRPQAEGKTLLEVVSPTGSRVDVREGQALVGRDAAPIKMPSYEAKGMTAGQAKALVAYAKSLKK